MLSVATYNCTHQIIKRCCFVCNNYGVHISLVGLHFFVLHFSLRILRCFLLLNVFFGRKTTNDGTKEMFNGAARAVIEKNRNTIEIPLGSCATRNTRNET